MKKSTKIIIIAGAAAVLVIAGVLLASHFVRISKEDQTAHIIGGADGPTAVFLAGKILTDGE